MIRTCLLCAVLLLAADSMASDPDRPPNVLLICVDDLRPELNCYGKDYIRSPNIDELAGQGLLFERHYVQAPTCGASRFALLTGRFGGGSNEDLFQRARQIEIGKNVPPSLPAWFRQHGYTTVSVGKVSHHPGGRGGKNWDDDAQPEMPNSWDRHLLPAGDWQHPRGWMHGLANGEIRINRSNMDVFQAKPGEDSIYPDGVMIDEALNQIKILADDRKPFFFACGILRPHLPFGAPAKYLEPYLNAKLPPIPHPQKPSGKTTWHRSGEFRNYNLWGRNPDQDAEFATDVRRHYAACVSFADAQVGKLIDALKKQGQWDNTIVILWGDHGWHLGEHAVWGKHTLFEESLRSPLIIRWPNMPKTGAQTSTIVETVDLFPTLCELAQLPIPDFAKGRTLVPELRQPESLRSERNHAVSYNSKIRTIRTNDFRMTIHQGGHVELYEHGDQTGSETKNVAADHPQIVEELKSILEKRWAENEAQPTRSE